MTLSSPVSQDSVTINPTEKKLFLGMGWQKLTGLLLFVVGLTLAYTLLPLEAWMRATGDSLVALGWLAIPIYALGYVVWAALFLPAALYSVWAGFMWGTFKGAMIAVPSVAFAALVSYGISRYLFRGRFRAWLMRRPKLHLVERAIMKRGIPLIFLMRFSPVIPFSLFNYLLGLTKIRAFTYTWVSFLGLIPITCMWSYVGEIGAIVTGNSAETAGTVKLVIGIMGLSVALFITAWVGQIVKKALRQAEESLKEEAHSVHSDSL